MDMERAGFLVAEIRCEVRDDCVHVFSPELPGFHLAVKTHDRYDEADLCEAIEWYFRNTKGMNIRASNAASPLQLLGGRAAHPERSEVRRVVMTPEFAVA